MPRNQPDPMRSAFEALHLDSIEGYIEFDEDNKAAEALGSDYDATFTRLKTILYSVTKTDKERKALDLLLAGKSRRTVQRELGMNWTSISNMLNTLKERYLACKQTVKNIKK